MKKGLFRIFGGRDVPGQFSKMSEIPKMVGIGVNAQNRVHVAKMIGANHQWRGVGHQLLILLAMPRKIADLVAKKPFHDEDEASAKGNENDPSDPLKKLQLAQ
jgi:hypothetical protein